MKKAMLAVLLLSVSVAVAAAGRTQSNELTATQQAMIRTWNNFMNKVIAMAEDTGYPEEKFDSRPHPDSRSFAEELRHVAYFAQAFAERARGAEVDFSGIAAREKQATTRAEMVAALQAGRDAFAEALAEKEQPGLIGFIAGMSEHYGKLVTIYRINDLVPPRSRR